MADGSITFSTALDNKQLEKDLRKATQDVESLKRKIEKGGDDKTYLAAKLKSAMKAAQDARAEIERLQASMGVEGGSKELAQHIREATRDAERLSKQLEEKTAKRTAIEEEMDKADLAIDGTKAKIRELTEEYERLRATGRELAAGQAQARESANPMYAEAIGAAKSKVNAQAQEKYDEAFKLRVALQEQEAEQDKLAEKWNALDGEVKEYEDEIRGANAAVAEMQGYMGTMQQAEATLKQHESDAKGLERKWNATDEKVREYQRDLERSKGRASALAQEASQTAPAWQRAAEAIRSRFSSAAEGIRNKMAQAASKSVSPWEQFSRRVSGLLKRVFIFGLILRGLNAIKNAIGGMLMQNERFSSSVANLKATFNGVLSAIVSAALPALTALVNTLAGVLERIAGLVDSIFGTNLVAGIQGQRQAEGDAIRQANAQKQAAYDEQVAQEQARYEQELAKAQEKQAKAQEKQAKAAEKNAKAQEKANSQLMAFDEINAMSAESTEDVTDAIEDYVDEVEGPDFSSIEAPELENDWTLGDFGDAGMMQGVLDWLDMLKDRILNDVEGPFARIREGLQQIAKGWDEIVEGIRTGDFGLIWKGITDIVIGACKVIEGAFAALMDWLDEVTGGRFTNIFQGLSEIVSGFEKVIEGILTGDFGLVVEGVVQILQGLYQTVIGILEGIKTLFGDLMDWLDEATGGQFHDIFEGLKTYVAGLSDFFVGILTLDIPLALTGLMEMIDGMTQFMSGVISAIADVIKGGVSWLFDFLSEKFPALSGFFQSTKDMICGIIDSVRDFLKADLDGVRQMMEGALNIIVGLVTLDGERITQGIDGVASGIRTIVDGLVNGVRGILESLFDWIRDGVSGVFDFLASQFPEAEGLFEGLKQFVLGILDVLQGTIFGVIDGIRTAVDGLIDGLRQIVEGGMDIVVGIFTGSGDRIIEGLKGVVNGFISIIEGLLDGVIISLVGFVNGITDGLSNIPGVDIPSISFSSVNLPRLAGGAVIPPNREFLAVLGDQSHGNNIETPEGLLRQVLREEIGPMLAEAILAISSQDGGGGDVNLVVQIDSETVARASSKGNASLARRGELVPEFAFV